MIDVFVKLPPAAFSVAEFRFLVKHMIDGIAKGVVPSFLGANRLPYLYESGIRYQEEPTHGTGIEYFDVPQVCLQRGWGDCDDLIIYRVAELLSQGVAAECSIADYKGAGGMHAQVRLPLGCSTPWSVDSPRGPIEDPSLILGAENHWPEKFTFDLE